MNPKDLKPNPEPPRGGKTGWKGAARAGDYWAGRPFLASFLAALLLTAPVLAVFRVYFQLNDDHFALFLLKGIGLSGAPSEFNQLENVLLCLCLKNLYAHFPQIQWYSGFLVLSQFLSFWALLAAFQMGSHRLFRTFLFLLGSAVISIHFFTDIQWTLTAALAAIGAILLLAAVWRREDAKFLPPALGLAFVLLLVSVLIRGSALLLVSLASVPAVLYLAWKNPMTPHRRSTLGFVGMTALLSLAAVAFHHYYYFHDQAWADSTRFFNAHNELEDFRNPVYNETTKPFFDSIGWTELDLGLFKNWYFMDPDTYSLEKLQKLNDYFPHFAFDKSQQETFAKMFSDYPTDLLILFFMTLLPFLPPRALRLMVANAAWILGVIVFCMLYLKIPERVYLPCFFLNSNWAIFFAVPQKPGLGENQGASPWAHKLGAVLLTLMFLLSLYFIPIQYRINSDWSSQEQELKAAVEDLNPQDGQLFVAWGSTFPFEKIGAFDDDGFLRHFHFVSLSWIQRAPPTQAMLGQFGLKNLFQDMVDNPSVFLICTPHQWYLYRAYMKEKYNREVYVKDAFRSEPFNVYRIQSTNPDKSSEGLKG